MIFAWSARNKLTVNTGKTKEIIFHRPASRHLNNPPPMPDIERVTQATLLEIDITSTLSTAAYVNRMLLQINQRLYLLSQLKSQGIAIQALHQLFTILTMSKITYALPSFAGQLTADDSNRINAISRKALCRGVTHTATIIILIANFSPRLPTLVIVYIIYSFLKLTVLTVLKKKTLLPAA